MLTVRRLYVYLVAGASLAVLITGLNGAGATLIELLLRGGALEGTYRQTIATVAAEILVALPLWVLHWRYAQRLAHRDPTERRAVLRRLYLYAVLSALLLALGQLANTWIDAALRVVLGLRTGTGDSTATGLLRTLWELALVGAFWVYPFGIANIDRVAVGESGGSATLRRWYAYGSQFVALLVGLAGAQALLQLLLLNLFAPTAVVGTGSAVAAGVAQTLVGFGIWLVQRQWTAQAPLAADDRHSTLRTVSGFGIVGIAVAATLVSIGQMLYWCLARLLGVPRPSGLPSDAVGALAGPLASAVVFGLAWAFTRRGLARDAAGAEAERQSGIRRLYQHLVAFIALATFTTGVGLLLWTLVDQFVGHGLISSATDFRDRISLSVTLLVVGLPVWLLSWRPAAPPEDRLALSRRLYLFASLLVSVLAGLGLGIWLVVQLVRLALGIGGPQPAVEIGHALGLLLVALAVLGYHGHVLWQDATYRAAHSRALPEVAPPVTPAPTVQNAVVVEITGATEDEVRAALGGLPAGATYRLRDT